MRNSAVKARPAPEERMPLIGGAAIEVLASKGIRGLTHREIDRHLNWPEGTTSRYYRTRDALMTAAVQHLVDIEMADVTEWKKAAVVAGSITVEGVVDILITNYHTWINNAERQIARYELSLEARRRPAVHEAIINARGSMCGAVQSTLAAAGFPHPETQAIVLLSALDGLCHDYLLHARYYVEPAHIEGIIRRWLGVEYDAPSHAYPESDIGAGAGS